MRWLEVWPSEPRACKCHFFFFFLMIEILIQIHTPAPSIYRLRLGLLGYLIPFTPLAFVSQC
jgi:hypothetical protein